MRYYLYSIDYGRGKLTGLQAVDDDKGEEFSLRMIKNTYKYLCYEYVLLFLLPVNITLASSLYGEHYPRQRFSDFKGDCFLSGHHPDGEDDCLR